MHGDIASCMCHVTFGLYPREGHCVVVVAVVVVTIIVVVVLSLVLLFSQSANDGVLVIN